MYIRHENYGEGLVEQTIDHQKGTDQQGGCLEEGASRLSKAYVSKKRDP